MTNFFGPEVEAILNKEGIALAFKCKNGQTAKEKLEAEIERCINEIYDDFETPANEEAEK